MKHYTEDGLYKGETHKMDDGSLHTGKTHTKSSKVVSHKKEGPFNMKNALRKVSPTLLKISASCKAAARKKFKVYPSAYANMWASKTQKKGKC